MLLRGGVLEAHAALSEKIQKPLGGMDIDAIDQARGAFIDRL